MADIKLLRFLTAVLRRLYPMRKREFSGRRRSDLAAALINENSLRFGDRNPRISVHAGPLVTFPYVHSDVGNLEIRVEGEEATLNVGSIAHGHFGPPDYEQADSDNVMGVCSHIIWLLNHLFADRVVFYSSSRGVGGWRVFEDGPLPRDSAEFVASLLTPAALEGFLGEVRTYVWSGPFPRQE